LPKPDFSRAKQGPLDELSFSNPFILAQTYSAAWFAPWVPPADPNNPNDLGSFGYQFGAKATKYCNGVKFGLPEPAAMARVDGNGLAAPEWNGLDPVVSQDVNFDSFSNNQSIAGTKLNGFDDWANIKLNQLGAGHVMGLVSSGGSDFGGSDFGGSDFGGSDFGGSDFGGSDFGGSDFGGSDFGGLDFEGSDFGGSDFGGSDFGGSDFGGQELDYDTAAALGFTPPTGLHACVIGTPGGNCSGSQPGPNTPTFHRVKLTWNQPGFGTVALYHVIRYRVDNLGHLVSPKEVGTGTTPAQDFCTAPGQICTTRDDEELPNGQQFAYVVKAAFTDGTKSGASQSSETITAVNDAPVALAEVLFTYEDTPVTYAGNLLSNDTDDDTTINPTTFTPLRAKLTSLPLNGVLTSQGHTLAVGDTFDGTFTFTPTPDAEGSDGFKYRANDGLWIDNVTPMSPDSNEVTVSITNLFSRHTTTTFEPLPSASIYGNSVTFTATVAAASSDSVTQFGKPAGTVTIKIDDVIATTGTPNANGQVTFATSLLTATGTGNHTITALYCAGAENQYCPDGKYYGSTGTFTHHVNPRPVTWVTQNASKTYGDPDPATLTTGASEASPNDFVTTDHVTATYSRVGGETVAGGPYHIMATLSPAAVLGNYTITNAGAAFAINPRPVTWTTNPNTKTYGDPDLNPLTSGSGSNFVAADNVIAAYSRAAGETVAGGPYHITATLSPAVVLGNYNITNAGAAFAINPRPATWTTNPNSKTYGDGDPSGLTTGSGSNFMAVDGITATYLRLAGETVPGPYHIAATLSPAGVLSNYNITNNGADFTITPRLVTITADAQTKVQGHPDPALTYQITSGSLVGGDGFSGALTRDSGETAGNYAITQGSVVLSSNYTLTYVGNMLTITNP
jgi:uncharacterized protein YjbI with pentapeptide repeats